MGRSARVTSTIGAFVPMMVFFVVVTVGNPNVSPSSVSAKDSGSGYTGWGASPNTSPENHRFVGGMSPSARRTGMRSLPGTVPSRSIDAARPSGCHAAPSPASMLPPVGESPGPGESSPEGDPVHPARSRAAAIPAAMARAPHINGARSWSGTPVQRWWVRQGRRRRAAVPGW